MPTYEFRCESGHATDRFYRSMAGAPAVIECPECGESAVRQVSGGIGLVFKGSGFYITDYGKDGKKPQPTGAQPAANSDTTADGGSSKSETAASASDSAGAKKSDSAAPAADKPDAGSPKKSSSE